MLKSNENQRFSLSGKTVLVTGASSGIGRECAISCSMMGARMIIVGRDQSRLSEVLNQLDEEHNNISFSFDIKDEMALQDFVKNLSSQEIEVHGLIHSAGISITLPIKLSSLEKAELSYRTNVGGPIELTRLLISRNGSMNDGSSIVFISSVMSVTGESGRTIYSSTKGAIVAASKSMAIELAKRKIRVNCVSPGVVKSPMSENAVYSRDADSLNNVEQFHPLGLGDPEDVANACIYLLSLASKWVTGTNLIVDGGYTAR